MASWKPITMSFGAVSLTTAILIAARLVVVGRRGIAGAQIAIARLRLVARGHHPRSVSNS